MDRRLRILHTESSHGWGGQEIRILTEARGMQDRGHEVMIATTGNAELLPAAARLGLRTAILPMRRKGIPELLAVRNWLAANHGSFDVINTHSSTDSWLVALARVTIPGCPPILRTRHVSTVVNTSFATRWLYRNATAHIVVTGEALRRQLHEQNGYPLEHMTSIRTGIDLKRFRPLDKGEMRRLLGVPDRQVIGILATLRDWKGHDYLLDALAILRQRFADLSLVIVGDGPRRAHLERRTDELGLRDSVRFAGNQDNVEQWLATFDIFALPSYGEEGVPQAIMQAMACGLPVISTRVGAILEAVVANQTGLLIPAHDGAALAAAIADLLQDPARRQRFSAAAVDYARANFGIGQMLDQMEEVFRSVAGSR
ncbi:MAG: glycosyltransferase family 4 protein [Burkholderiales bacterium]